jgi:hypothetical protein
LPHGENRGLSRGAHLRFGQKAKFTGERRPGEGQQRAKNQPVQTGQE